VSGGVERDSHRIDVPLIAKQRGQKLTDHRAAEAGREELLDPGHGERVL